jgi:alkyl hydroperoxide reductase subunit AhpC
MVVTVGERAPEFRLKGVLNENVSEYSLKKYRGKWLVLFFYPADFSFICPTEVTGFNNMFNAFKTAGIEILGISVDPIDLHIKWVRELGGLQYPLLSDESKTVSRLYNVLDEEEGVSMRATFIIDPDGIVQYMMVIQHNVGRSVEETLRVALALQTGKMCPADWKPGEETFDRTDEKKF